MVHGTGPTESESSSSISSSSSCSTGDNQLQSANNLLPPSLEVERPVTTSHDGPKLTRRLSAPLHAFLGNFQQPNAIHRRASLSTCNATAFRRTDRNGETPLPPLLRTPSNSSMRSSFSLRRSGARQLNKVMHATRQLLKKKTVKFCNGKHLSQVKLIEEVCEYSPEEVDVIWFSYRELDLSKRDAEDLGALWEAQPQIASRTADEDPFRGLEDKTPEGQWNAYKIRREVLHAVLDEQEVRCTPSQLAEVSLKISSDNLLSAVERAKVDAQEAQEYCADIRLTFRVAAKTSPPSAGIDDSSESLLKEKKKKRKDKSKKQSTSKTGLGSTFGSGLVRKKGSKTTRASKKARRRASITEEKKKSKKEGKKKEKEEVHKAGTKKAPGEDILKKRKGRKLSERLGLKSA